MRVKVSPQIWFPQLVKLCSWTFSLRAERKFNNTKNPIRRTSYISNATVGLMERRKRVSGLYRAVMSPPPLPCTSGGRLPSQLIFTSSAAAVKNEPRWAANSCFVLWLHLQSLLRIETIANTQNMTNGLLSDQPQPAGVHHSVIPLMWVFFMHRRPHTIIITVVWTWKSSQIYSWSC